MPGSRPRSVTAGPEHGRDAPPRPPGLLCLPCTKQGAIAQSPMRFPRHHILGASGAPPPHADDEVVAFFRVIDAVRDRTMFFLMLRCGLRVSEVSHLAAALDFAQARFGLITAKGRWIGWCIWPPMSPKPSGSGSGCRAAPPRYVFPSRVTRKGAAR